MKPMDNVTEPIFECCHCSLEVTPNETMGTQHRNHCSHCLWSKHVDTTPGDRASTCQGCMEPIGVTLKHEGQDKYGKEKLGDVMLVHRCTDCNAINLNRIAADDPEDLIVKAYEHSTTLPQATLDELATQDITLLADKKILEEKLFGKSL
ncbi:MAG: RNHCP domain-containing protein [Candidatus Pacebacteria bacterium]|nr:RNHCP domain-containing protein [Candidatus Paceibacterota bacterium]